MKKYFIINSSLSTVIKKIIPYPAFPMTETDFIKVDVWIYQKKENIIDGT